MRIPTISTTINIDRAKILRNTMTAERRVNNLRAATVKQNTVNIGNTPNITNDTSLNLESGKILFIYGYSPMDEYHEVQ